MKWTVPKIKALKGEQKVTSLTAYDTLSARYADEAGIPLILVGDSLAMTVLGYETTLPITMDEMVHHTAAVSRGVQNGLVVADMPFMSYQVSVEDAVRNAGGLVKEGGAQSVKLEGGERYVPVIKAIIQASIPVVGHLGLTPQSLHEFGGYRVQGRDDESAERLISDAKALERAGCFAIVLEGIPWQLARTITESVSIATIGIGAGPYCDGQVLVIHDMLGIYEHHLPKFVKMYENLGERIRAAVSTYVDDVKEGRFPGMEHSYSADGRKGPSGDQGNEKGGDSG